MLAWISAVQRLGVRQDEPMRAWCVHGVCRLHDGQALRHDTELDARQQVRWGARLGGGVREEGVRKGAECMRRSCA